MTTDSGIQVAKPQEDEQMQFVHRMIQLYQDAANAPTLRREVEGLRAEVETLNKQIADLKAEVELEREARVSAQGVSREHERTIAKLNNRLSRLQHRFDTIQGVVQAALAEAQAEADKEKAEREKQLRVVEGNQGWNPPNTSQERSFG